MNLYVKIKIYRQYEQYYKYYNIFFKKKQYFYYLEKNFFHVLAILYKIIINAQFRKDKHRNTNINPIYWQHDTREISLYRIYLL